MFFLFWFKAYRRSMLEKDYKGTYYHHKLSWGLVNDEEAMLSESNWICGDDQHVLPIVYAYQLCGRPRRRDYKRRIKGAKHWGKGNNEIQNIISFYQKKVFFDSCINYYNHSKRIGILGRIGWVNKKKERHWGS